MRSPLVSRLLNLHRSSDIQLDYSNEGQSSPSTLLPFHLNRKPGTVRLLANAYCIERDNVKKSHDKRARISIEKFCFHVDEKDRGCVPRGILRFEPMYIVPWWQTS